jgi:hypothetical protein
MLTARLNRRQKMRPQRLKAESKQSSYRSAEALRHPKAKIKSSFSASCEAVPFENRVELSHYPPLWRSFPRRLAVSRPDCAVASSTSFQNEVLGSTAATPI